MCNENFEINLDFIVVLFFAKRGEKNGFYSDYLTLWDKGSFFSPAFGCDFVLDFSYLIEVSSL